MQPNTDTLQDPTLFRDLNRRCIPVAAHEAVLSGAVIIAHGVIRFGAWSFPATPAFLFEIFDLIDRYQRRHYYQGALNFLRSRGCGEAQLQRIATAMESNPRVVNLTPFQYRRRPVWRSRRSL